MTRTRLLAVLGILSLAGCGGGQERADSDQTATSRLPAPAADSDESVPGESETPNPAPNEASKTPPATTADPTPTTDEAQPSLLAQLGGEWHVVEIEMQGETLAKQPGMPEVLVIQDGVFNAQSAGSPVDTFSNLRVQVDASATPHHLDLVRMREEQVESLPCIVEIAEDELKISMPLVPANKQPEDPLDRPTSFDSSQGPFMVLTAQRIAAGEDGSE